MSKTKSPLLSLGARGTIADTLTYQKRGQLTIAREKPIPKDPYSLNQAYQRWDYRDYAYQWTLLSDSEKQIYHTKASRYHITGFSQWMREKLNTLPDLSLRWHLDEKSGAVVYDSSKQGINGTIIGASPATGVINSAYYFDGLNDKIVSASQFTMDGDRTISFFVIPHFNYDDGSSYGFLEWAADANNRIYLYKWADNTIQFVYRGGGVSRQRWTTYPFVSGDILHITLTIDIPSGSIALYINGVYQTSCGFLAAVMSSTPGTLTLGLWSTYWLEGILDELKIHDRSLDTTEILRHSERRYPA